MYRTIREQGNHLVQLVLERDHAILELDQVKLELAAVRAENEDLRAQPAKCRQAIKAYDNQHTPPSRKHIAEQYTTKFSKTLAKAAPNLFTFVLCNVEPTYTPR